MPGYIKFMSAWKKTLYLETCLLNEGYVCNMVFTKRRLSNVKYSQYLDNKPELWKVY